MSGPRSLSRRDLVRVGCVTFGTAFSGCLSNFTATGPQTTTTETGVTSTRTTGGETSSHDISRFAGQACPTLQQHADRTVCYHTLDHDDPPPVYLEPSAEQLTDWNEDVTYTLHNKSDHGIGLDCDPRIYRRRRQGWVIFKTAPPRGCVAELDPGEQFHWHLPTGVDPTVTNVDSRPIHWFPNSDETPSGMFAISTDTTPQGEDDAPTTEHVALFEVAVETPQTTRPRRTSLEEYPSEVVRCRGDPVSIEISKTDESGWDDSIKYFPSNRTVKCVKTRTGFGGAASFGKKSLKDWARLRALTGRARERVRVVTRDRLGGEEVYVNEGPPPDSADVDSRVLWVSAHATETVDDDIVPAPVSLEAISDAAPKTTRTTVSLDGDTVELAIPVFAQITVGW